jgi:hypothetical protein
MPIAQQHRSVVAPRGRNRDAVVCAILGVVATIVGASYLGAARRAGVPFNFYQPAFGPAVMAACGRGFVNPVPAAGSPLAKFLSEGAARFDCATLESHVEQNSWTPFQQSERYLLLASAGVWTTLGITWRSLDVIGGMFFGLSIALVYLVFRLALPTWLSAGLSIVWLTSPGHLLFLTTLRDCSKAPFFVLTILVVATVILKRMSARRLIAVSAVLGMALGIGFGFRTDVAINLAPFVAAVMLFSPDGLRRRFGTRVLAIVVCVSAFWMCARPVLNAYRGGNNLWHVSLLGLMDPFDQHLGVTPSIYSFGNSYSDDLMITIVNSYAARVQPGAAEMTDTTPEYERFTRRYFFDLVRTFPADFAIRCWASVIKVLNLPFAITYGDVPLGVRSTAMRTLYRVRMWLLAIAEGITPALLCGLIVALAIDSSRYAIALAALVLFFAAYPTLQYDGRHVFHLEFVPLWIDAVALWGLVSNASEIRHWFFERRAVRRMLWTAAAIAVVVVGPMSILRRSQPSRVRRMAADYANASKNEVVVDALDISDQTTRLRIAMPPTTEDVPVAADMIAVDVSGEPATCRRGVLLTVRYLQRDNSSRDDFAHVIRVPTTGGRLGSSVAFVPIYLFAHNPFVRFVGIDVRREQSACISRVSRLANVRQFPLLLETVVVAGGLNAVPLYQQLNDDIEIAPPHLRSAVRRFLKS